jgi:hypothetical protein
MSFPLTLPSNRQVVRVRMNANDIVSISSSPFTAQQQVYKYPGQFWEAEVTLRPLSRDEAELWNGFFLSLNGAFGTFLFGDPVGQEPRGVATGTPLVKGAGQTGGSLITDGWTPSVSGILKAGDYIQLGTASAAKLYKVLETANSDSGGNATLKIWPNLRSSPADNAAVITNNPRGVFRCLTPVTWTIEEAQQYGITFGAREAL